MTYNLETEAQLKQVVSSWNDRRDFLSLEIQLSTFYTFQEELFPFTLYLSTFVEDIFCRLSVLNLNRNLKDEDTEIIAQILYPDKIIISVGEGTFQVNNQKEPESLFYMKDSRLLSFIPFEEDRAQILLSLLKEALDDRSN